MGMFVHDNDDEIYDDSSMFMSNWDDSEKITIQSLDAGEIYKKGKKPKERKGEIVKISLINKETGEVVLELDPLQASKYEITYETVYKK